MSAFIVGDHLALPATRRTMKTNDHAEALA